MLLAASTLLAHANAQERRVLAESNVLLTSVF
jgi:hypothetical protein